MSKKARLGFKDHINKTFELLARNKKVIFGIWLLHTAVFYVFSSGISAVDITDFKDTLESVFGLDTGSIGGRLVLSFVVVQGVNTLEANGSAYILFFTIAMILALVWVLRNSWQDKTTTMRDAYYQGLYPMAQFFLLVILSVAQLLPLALGSYLMNTAIQNDVFVSTPEVVGGAIVLILLPSIWVYSMLVRTMMAMFIATIPKKKPMEAFKAAKQMLKGNKVFVMRNLFIWSLLILAVFLVFILLAIAISPLVAIIISIIFNTLFVLMLTSFSYTVYRGLL